MFRFLKNKRKYTYPEIKIPEGCREMTEEEKLLVNGGRRIGNSVAEQAEAEPGDILVDDDGNEHELGEGDINWAKDEMAKRNRTETTTPPASGISGGGTTGSGGSSGGGNASSNSTTTSSNNNDFKTVNLMDGLYENSTIGKFEKRNTEKIVGGKIGGRTINANEHSHHSGSFRNPVSGKDYNSQKIVIPKQIDNSLYAQNLKESGGTYYNNIRNANTPITGIAMLASNPENGAITLIGEDGIEAVFTMPNEIRTRFEKVEGKPYAIDREGQSFDSVTGIVNGDSDAFNCIGLVTYLFQIKGSYDCKNFASYSEFEEMENVTSTSDLRPTDIIWWKYTDKTDETKKNQYHVQMWAGDGMTWESAYGKGVREKDYQDYIDYANKNFEDFEVKYYRWKN